MTKDLTLSRLLIFLIKKFERAIETLSSPNCLVADVSSLEAVAEIRVVFRFLSDLIYQYVSDPKWIESHDIKNYDRLKQLFGLLSKSFSSIPSVHPRFFFLRQLLRTHGSGDLTMVVQTKEFDWLWSFQDEESVRVVL